MASVRFRKNDEFFEKKITQTSSLFKSSSHTTYKV